MFKTFGLFAYFKEWPSKSYSFEFGALVILICFEFRISCFEFSLVKAPYFILMVIPLAPKLIPTPA